MAAQAASEETTRFTRVPVIPSVYDHTHHLRSVPDNSTIEETYVGKF